MSKRPPAASVAGREAASGRSLLFLKTAVIKTNLYIDGFNLYYGALKDTPYKWLDLAALSRRLLPKNEIHRIRYFTALVQSRDSDPQQAQRQQTYIRAIETLPQVSVHYGRFLTSTKRMPLANPPAAGPRTVEVIKTEEKGSDVNLGAYLLLDGFKDEYEVGVVVSNDSDLVHPIELVRDHLGLDVGVVNPQRHGSSWALRNAASFYRKLREWALKECQLPDTLTDAHGTITKPEAW